jgi:RHS repeat-associated protein
VAVTEYIWDVENDSYLMETDENGATQAVYTNEPSQFGGLVSQRRDGQTSYYHDDALGSTRQLTDSEENVTDEYEYTAWGEPVAESGTTESPFRWVGRWGYYWDDGTGTYYIRRRDYQPRSARWMSEDPLSYVVGMNLYQYVSSNAIGFIDPLGLNAAEDALGITLLGRWALRATTPVFAGQRQINHVLWHFRRWHPATWILGEDTIEDSWIPGSDDVIFGLEEVNAYRERVRKDLRDFARTTPPGTYNVSGDSSIIFNVGPDNMLRSVLNESTIRYKATITITDVCAEFIIDWTFYDQIDANSYAELKDKGYFNKESSLFLKASGVVEGAWDFTGDKISGAWYDFQVSRHQIFVIVKIER